LGSSFGQRSYFLIALAGSNVRIAMRLLLAMAILFGLGLATPNYYEVLDVRKDASLHEIRKAYKRKALEWHPDRNPDPQAEERFRDIAAAYEVLSNNDRRKQYDSGGDMAFDFNFDFDPNAIFKEFFQGSDLGQLFDQAFADVAKETAGIFDGIDGIFGAGQGDGFSSSFSSFASFTSYSSGDGVQTKSQRVETIVTPDGRRVTKSVESGGDGHITARREERHPGGTLHLDSGSPRLVSDGLEDDARCRGGFDSGQEPSDTAVDHVAGSACCNASPRPSATDSLGCCRRCAANAQCDVFVWQPSGGSCWLLRWKDSALRPKTPATDRVMRDLRNAVEQ